MTERRAGSLRREPHGCTIGPSSLTWDGNALTIDISETSVPIPRRVTGRVRIIPSSLPARSFPLDSAGAHVWWPIAPRARVEVTFDKPGLGWTGSGYLDCNFGSRPLEADFKSWDWSRADMKDGAAVLYDVLRNDGSALSLGLRFDGQGRVEEVAPPPLVELPRATVWRMPRRTRAEPGSARIAKTLEDTPFYARSVLRTRLFGEQTTAIHESLSLDRFASPLVRLLLPFRMPRALS
jgi:carotenoid 1,2-hydratase